MRIYTVKISSSARKSIRKIPLLHQQRILKAVGWLKIDPFLGKKLTGEYKGYHRVKVWPYRIVYKIQREELIIEVVEIDHRGNISYG
jgi:addiction module RelE/StbE family toxin